MQLTSESRRLQQGFVDERFFLQVEWDREPRYTH